MSDRVYGYDVTYTTDRGETLQAHFVGSEANARRKTMLRSGARFIAKVEPLTEAQYVRAFGRGRS